MVSHSYLLPVSCGITQDSILGSLLFLIHINELPSASTFHVRLFADDTNQTLLDSNFYRLYIEVNDELTKIDKWIKLNKLAVELQEDKNLSF